MSMEKNITAEEVEKIRKEKLKALEATIGNIEKACGKGSIMRLGESAAEKVESIPTGSLGLDFLDWMRFKIFYENATIKFLIWYN